MTRYGDVFMIVTCKINTNYEGYERLISVLLLLLMLSSIFLSKYENERITEEEKMIDMA